MKKEVFNSNPLLKSAFDFSLILIDYCEKLEANKRYVVSNQLLRAGTSIGANAMEAQNAESKADFIHKIRISAKEAEETQYWLWLCHESKNYPDCSNLLVKLEEINKILASIISTVKKQLSS